MSTSWKAILGVILIFIFGVFSGVICSSIVVHRKLAAFLQHPAVALVDAFEKRVTRNLNLDPGQKQQIHELFMQNLNRRKELQKQIQPQVQALNQSTLQQINAVLRPDQKDRLSQNIEEMKRRIGQGAPGANDENKPVVQPEAPSTNSGVGTPPRGQ